MSKSRPEMKIAAIWVHETQMSFQRRCSCSIDHTTKIWRCILLPMWWWSQDNSSWFPQSPMLAPEVMLETSSDPAWAAKPRVRRSPRPHSHRSLCCLGVCCRITHRQVGTWPWLSCCGTAKGHPEPEQNSSTFPLQSLPEWATRQPLWTERWRARAGSDEINSGDRWFIA